MVPSFTQNQRAKFLPKYQSKTTPSRAFLFRPRIFKDADKILHRLMQMGHLQFNVHQCLKCLWFSSLRFTEKTATSRRRIDQNLLLAAEMKSFDLQPDVEPRFTQNFTQAEMLLKPKIHTKFQTFWGS